MFHDAECGFWHDSLRHLPITRVLSLFISHRDAIAVGQSVDLRPVEYGMQKDVKMKRSVQESQWPKEYGELMKDVRFSL